MIIFISPGCEMLKGQNLMSLRTKCGKDEKILGWTASPCPQR